MDRYNSNTENTAFNQTENGRNLPPTNIPSNVPDGTEGNGIDLNERSNETTGDTYFHGNSRTLSDFVSGVTKTDLIPARIFPNNAGSYLQMQNLWHASTTSFSHSRQFQGASNMAFLENSTHRTFIEKHRGFHGGSSSASRNQSNAFIHPFGGPAGYFGENGLWNRGNDANFLRNIIDPPPSLLIGKTITGGRSRDPGHRDNPIVIEDDEEDEHDDTQQDGMFYDVEMSYKAFLALQEHIGGIEIGLNKNIISKLLKHSRYQIIKMKNCINSCCICLETYEDGEVLGKIGCGHEFHCQFIEEWLEIKNSCPVCRRIALTSASNLWF
ncbi:E3 ubiquitin-protein ligase BIG BROTHER [Solanum pennellii]|uniref:RING-type E3 ubiquitin transferase n=1 Tax=Solanum pennellii TaxID=28526 RepID=A0ABM1GBF3_SOLPN|nr:E3 ubiquitin-protein ligase BIG BROTHER [Solanum pennellii]